MPAKHIIVVAACVALPFIAHAQTNPCTTGGGTTAAGTTAAVTNAANLVMPPFGWPRIEVLKTEEITGYYKPSTQTSRQMFVQVNKDGTDKKELPFDIGGRDDDFRAFPVKKVRKLGTKNTMIVPRDQLLTVEMDLVKVLPPPIIQPAPHLQPINPPGFAPARFIAPPPPVGEGKLYWRARSWVRTALLDDENRTFTSGFYYDRRADTLKSTDGKREITLTGPVAEFLLGFIRTNANLYANANFVGKREHDLGALNGIIEFDLRTAEKAMIEGHVFKSISGKLSVQTNFSRFGFNIDAVADGVKVYQEDPAALIAPQNHWVSLEVVDGELTAMHTSEPVYRRLFIRPAGSAGGGTPPNTP